MIEVRRVTTGTQSPQYSIFWIRSHKTQPASGWVLTANKITAINFGESTFHTSLIHRTSKKLYGQPRWQWFANTPWNRGGMAPNFASSDRAPDLSPYLLGAPTMADIIILDKMWPRLVELLQTQTPMYDVRRAVL